MGSRNHAAKNSPLLDKGLKLDKIEVGGGQAAGPYWTVSRILCNIGQFQHSVHVCYDFLQLEAEACPYDKHVRIYIHQ